MSPLVDWTTMPLPYVDYSVKDNVTLPYTATKDQLLVFAIQGSGVGAIIEINGNRAAQNNLTSAVTVSLFVHAGDEVKQQANGAPSPAYIYAYDVKWS